MALHYAWNLDAWKLPFWPSRHLDLAGGRLCQNLPFFGLCRLAIKYATSCHSLEPRWCFSVVFAIWQKMSVYSLVTVLFFQRAILIIKFWLHFLECCIKEFNYLNSLVVLSAYMFFTSSWPKRWLWSKEGSPGQSVPYGQLLWEQDWLSPQSADGVLWWTFWPKVLPADARCHLWQLQQQGTLIAIVGMLLWSVG